MNENTYYAPFGDHQGVISAALDEIRDAMPFNETTAAGHAARYEIIDELDAMRAAILSDRDALAERLATAGHPTRQRCWQKPGVHLEEPMNCDLCPEHAVVGYCEEHATELGERIDTMQDRIDVLKTALREIEAKIAETQAEALSWTESDDRLSAFKEGTNEVLYIARRALVGGA